MKAIAKIFNRESNKVRSCDAQQLGLQSKRIARSVTDVIAQLQDHDFEAYMVGGSVRDLLLAKTPKDFDIATDAYPEKVRRIFRNSRIIGRRFKIVHVYRDHLIEVSTFRRSLGQGKAASDKHLSLKGGQIVRDNAYGSIEEDAMRRDFTVNSIYYDPINEQVVHHPQALHDIKKGLLRAIGDPATRYREDPVRMLRAIRFAAKLSFRIEKKTADAIKKHRRLILKVPKARLFDGLNKLFRTGSAERTYQLLRQYELLALLFPMTERALQGRHAKRYDRFLCELLRESDQRVAAELDISLGFIVAGLWWVACDDTMRAEDIQDFNARRLQASKDYQQLLDDITAEQAEYVTLTPYIRNKARALLKLLPQFKATDERAIRDTLDHASFRLAYDMLCLLAQQKLFDQELCDWWARIQDAKGAKRSKIIQERAQSKKPRRRR